MRRLDVNVCPSVKPLSERQLSASDPVFAGKDVRSRVLAPPVSSLALLLPDALSRAHVPAEICLG